MHSRIQAFLDLSHILATPCYVMGLTGCPFAVALRSLASGFQNVSSNGFHITWFAVCRCCFCHSSCGIFTPLKGVCCPLVRWKIHFDLTKINKSRNAKRKVLIWSAELEREKKEANYLRRSFYGSVWRVFDLYIIYIRLHIHMCIYIYLNVNVNVNVYVYVYVGMCACFIFHLSYVV